MIENPAGRSIEIDSLTPPCLLLSGARAQEASVYVNFSGEWLIPQARDGGCLKGRYRPEVEVQMREEDRRRRTLAQELPGWV